MRITLPLSPDERLLLEQCANECGMDVGDYVVDLIRRQLQLVEHGRSCVDIPSDEWHSQFRTWIGSHRSRNPDFDDQRESMYD